MPEAPEQFGGAYVSANTFQLIGQHPVIGRDFGPADDRPGAEPTVVLGNGIWKNRYGSDRSTRLRSRHSTSKAVDCLRLWPNTPTTDAWSSSRAPSTCSILRTLQWGPQHGHGIGQAIRAQSDDLLKVETGSLYPALHRLVKRGWLKAEWGVSEANQRAKYYRLTAAGKAQLLRERDRWSQLVDAIGRIMNPAPTRQGVADAPRRATTSTTKSAATSRSASRSGSSAARIPKRRAWRR